MARRQVAQPAVQEIDVSLDLVGNGLAREAFCPYGGQFDGQGHALDKAADANDALLLFSQVKIRPDPGGAGGE